MFGRKKSTAATGTTTTTTTKRSHPKPLLRTILNLVRLLIHLLSLYMLGLFIYQMVLIKRSKVGVTKTRNNREYLSILVLSGVSVIWSFFSLLLTCFGHTKSSLLLVLIDLIHVGAFVGVSILLKSEGFRNCKRIFPSGAARRDCNLLKTAFAFAIALAVLYFIATILSLLLAMAFRKSRAYGPSPDNGYSASHNPTPRSKKHRDDPEAGYIAPMTTVAASHGAHHNRHSALTDDTAYTGSTMANHHHQPGVPDGVNGVKLNDPNAVRGQTPVAGYEPYRKPAHDNTYDARNGRF